MKKFIFFLLISISFIMETGAQQDTTALTKQGEKAPAFSCKFIDGKGFDLNKLHGKIVMINFFATWCPGCNLELPALQKDVWEKYRDNPGFVLIVIGREHTDQELSDFAKSKNLTLPFAADPKREIYNLYATKYIPRNIVIDRDGKILYQESGFTATEFAEIEKLIADSLK